MRTFLLLFCFLQILSIQVFAQLRIVDQTDKQPIAFVRIITEDGKLAASSDINGLVDTTFLAQKLKSGQTFMSLSHASYQTKDIRIADFRRSPVLDMKRRIVNLPEISVENSSKDKRIRIIRGYFRSYMLEENVPKFYTDGICEYYLTAEGKTRGIRLVEYRTYRNPDLLKREKRKGLNVVFRVSSVPSLPEGKLFKDRLSKGFVFKATTGGYNISIGKVQAGTIRSITGTEDIQTSMNGLAPKKTKAVSLLGCHFETTQEDRSQRYHSTTMDNLRYEHLASLTDIIQFWFSYPDEPKTHSTVLHEFYVYDVRFVQKSALKGVKFDGGELQYGHAYSYPYWEELSKHNVPALSKTISGALGKTLLLY